MDLNDTIVALSTPFGRGAIAIVRLSGERSWEIGQKLFRPYKEKKSIEYRMLQYGIVFDPIENEVIDEALVVFLDGPKTYTRQDMVEFQLHGSTITTEKVIKACLIAGARPAQPGEFTQRAFLNGRIDLTQAEAVNNLIMAETEGQADLALQQIGGSLRQKIDDLNRRLEKMIIQVQSEVEFPEDLTGTDYEEFRMELDALRRSIGKLISLAKRVGQMTRHPVIALIGNTNVGKSSLMNAVLGRKRALVDAEPGTTRDYLDERINLNGLTSRLVDTAGLREKANVQAMEAAGMEITSNFMAQADVILFVQDLTDKDTWKMNKAGNIKRSQKAYYIGNKSDLVDSRPIEEYRAWSGKLESFVISAKTGKGVDEMIELIGRELKRMWILPEGSEYTPNERQRLILEETDLFLEKAEELLAQGQTADMIGLELEGAAAKLYEVTGLADQDKLLDQLFGQFCIGK